MRELFYPQSVVVVGVSPDPRNYGRIIAENLDGAGYRGEVYLVGREGSTVTGRHVYPSIGAIPADHVDLATVIIPARSVPQVLEDAGQKGATWAITLTSGFSEYGDDRQDLEQAVRDVLRRWGMHMVGPNCQAVMNASNGLILPFAPTPKESARPGPIALVSQSGTVAVITAHQLSEDGVGFSKVVSMGNKLDRDEVDYVTYLLQDDETSVICLHLEGISRGRELLEVASRGRKPIVIYKTNTSPASRQIAHSHTAAMASNDAIAESAFRQAGLIQAHSTAEMVSFAKALLLPPLLGDRLAVISSSGGSAVIGADLCAAHGFVLSALPEDLLASVAQHARASVIKLSNPMDLGDISDLAVRLEAVDRVLALPYIDGMVVNLHFFPTSSTLGRMTYEEMLQGVAELMQKHRKPVAMSFATQRARIAQLQQASTLPLFWNIEESMHAMAAARRWGKTMQRRAIGGSRHE